MYKLICTVILCLLFAVVTNAQQYNRIQGYVQLGGGVIPTSPSTSYTVQFSYPSSTVTVYLKGTTTLAAIYSDSSGTIKSNPFLADSTGYYYFYVATGNYDIKFSGTGISNPFSLSDINAGAIGNAFTIIDPKASPYNAKCDGVTDDTTSFRNAIAAIPDGGELIIPNGVCLLTSASGTSILTISKSYTIVGMGIGSDLRFKSGTATNVPMFDVKPPLNNSVTTFGTAADKNNVGLNFSNFIIDAEVPGQGGDGIKINIYNAQAWVNSLNISYIRMYRLGGKSIDIINDNGAGSWNNLNGSIATRIEHNFLYGGLYGKYASDSLEVNDNVFRGFTGERAIDLTFILGAGNPRITKNVIVSNQGVVLHNGAGVIFTDNYVEAFAAGTTGIDGAYVDFAGDVAPIDGGWIQRNILNTDPTLAIDTLRLGATNAITYDDNSHYSVSAGHYDLNISANSVNPFLAWNRNSGANRINNLSTSTVKGLYSALAPVNFGGYSGVAQFDISNYATIGSTPALSGAIRLGNNLSIFSRNSINTLDSEMISGGSDDRIHLGFQSNGLDLRPDTGYVYQKGILFANLGVPLSNGVTVYCSDCTETSDPCTGSGTGSYAKRLNNRWVCSK